MLNRTPAPWTIREGSCNSRRVFGPDDTLVAEVGGHFEDHHDGNARLIASSPRLLAASKAVLSNWESGDLAAAVRELAEVVAEAEGNE